MPYPLVPLFDTRIRVLDTSEAPVARIRVDADPGPPPVPGGRPKGSKQPHTNATVAAVRHLVEQTVLTYREITAKTGVANGTISKWCRDFGWKRHPFAPRPTDTMPTARASRKLKLRLLGNKLHLLAERCAAEMWNSPSVDLDRLVEALQVLRMTRVEYQSNRRPRISPVGRTRTAGEWVDRETAIRKALEKMRRGGVNIDRIPDEAMALLEDAHTPPEQDHPALRPRGPRRRG
jgi:hypothetical protein